MITPGEGHAPRDKDCGGCCNNSRGIAIENALSLKRVMMKCASNVYWMVGGGYSIYIVGKQTSSNTSAYSRFRTGKNWFINDYLYTVLNVE